MTIKRLIGTINAAALGEDRAKIRAEYIESDSISSIMSCLRRDDEVESQSTSEALAQQGDLVSENNIRHAGPDGRCALVQVWTHSFKAVVKSCCGPCVMSSSSRPPRSPLHA